MDVSFSGIMSHMEDLARGMLAKVNVPPLVHFTRCDSVCWQGECTVEDLCYRFSFIFCFILLMIIVVIKRPKKPSSQP